MTWPTLDELRRSRDVKKLDWIVVKGRDVPREIDDEFVCYSRKIDGAWSTLVLLGKSPKPWAESRIVDAVKSYGAEPALNWYGQQTVAFTTLRTFHHCV